MCASPISAPNLHTAQYTGQPVPATPVAHAYLLKAFPLSLKYPELENKFCGNFLKVKLTGINSYTNIVTPKKYNYNQLQ